MNQRRERPQLHPRLHGERDLRDHRPRARREDMSAQDPAPLPDDDLDSAHGGALGDRPVQVPDVVDVRGHRGSMAIHGLGFGEPDVGEFGLRVGAPRDHAVVDVRAHGKERVLHDGARFVVGDVREQEAADDVAGGEDVFPGCAQLRIDGDPALRGLHPCRVESHSLRIRRAPRGDQHLVDLERFGRDPRMVAACVPGGGDRHAPPVSRPVDPCHDVARPDLDALLTQPARQEFSQLRLLAHHEPVEQLHHRDVRAEAAEGLGEFDADRPAADHGERGGDRVAVEGFGVREVTCLLKPRDRRHRRPGAGGDDETARADAAAVHLDFVRRNEAGRPLDHIDAHGAKTLGIIVRLDHGPSGADAGENVRSLDRRPDGPQAVRGGVTKMMRHPGRADQGLGGHASGPEAVAAQAVALDQRHVRAEPRAPGGGHETRRTSANGDDVEHPVSIHVATPHERNDGRFSLPGVPIPA